MALGLCTLCLTTCTVNFKFHDVFNIYLKTVRMLFFKLVPSRTNMHLSTRIIETALYCSANKPIFTDFANVVFWDNLSIDIHSYLFYHWVPKIATLILSLTKNCKLQK